VEKVEVGMVVERNTIFDLELF